jgi:hypothetical protein
MIAVHHFDLNPYEYNSRDVCWTERLDNCVNDYHIIGTHAVLEYSNFTKEDLQDGGGEGKSSRQKRVRRRGMRELRLCRLFM